MGGSFSVFQWGSRAKRHLPEITALGRTYNYKGEVLIVGAGAAGLAAARVLEQNQVQYVVMVNAARVCVCAESGGRCLQTPLAAENARTIG